MDDDSNSDTLSTKLLLQVEGEDSPFKMEILTEYTKVESKRILTECTKVESKHHILLAPRLSGHESCITSTFREFARSPAHIVPFMKRLLSYVEDQLKLKDYHLRIVPAKWIPANSKPSEKELADILDKSKSSESELQQAAAAVGWQAYVVSDNRACEADDSMSHLKFDEPIKYKDKTGKTVELSLSTNDLSVIPQPTEAGFQVVLDAQARPTYVVVCGPDFREVGPDNLRFARRQNQFTDDELADFWRAAVDVIDANHGSTTSQPNTSSAEISWNQDLFEDMRLNAGTFQNVAHIHLKVKMSKDMFHGYWANDDTFKTLIVENGIEGS